MGSSERKDILRALEAEDIPIPKGSTSSWDNCDMKKYLRRMIKEKKKDSKEGENEKGDDVQKGFPEEKEEKEQTSGGNTKLLFRRKCEVVEVRIYQLSVTLTFKETRLNFLTYEAVFSCLCRKLRRIGR